MFNHFNLKHQPKTQTQKQTQQQQIQKKQPSITIKPKEHDFVLFTYLKLYLVLINIYSNCSQKNSEKDKIERELKSLSESLSIDEKLFIAKRKPYFKVVSTISQAIQFFQQTRLCENWSLYTRDNKKVLDSQEELNWCLQLSRTNSKGGNLYDTICTSYYWDGMKDDIEYYVSLFSNNNNIDPHNTKTTKTKTTTTSNKRKLEEDNNYDDPKKLKMDDITIRIPIIHYVKVIANDDLEYFTEQDYKDNEKIKLSIMANQNKFSGSVVLDINLTNGILAYFALKAGSRKVYSISNDQSSSSSKQGLLNYFDKLGFKDRYSIVTSLDQIKEPSVNILLYNFQQQKQHQQHNSEIYSNFYQYLPLFINARDKLLSSDGLIFPTNILINFTVFSNPLIYNNNGSSFLEDVEKLTEKYKCSTIKELATKSIESTFNSSINFDPSNNTDDKNNMIQILTYIGNQPKNINLRSIKFNELFYHPTTTNNDIRLNDFSTTTIFFWYDHDSVLDGYTTWLDIQYPGEYIDSLPYKLFYFDFSVPLTRFQSLMSTFKFIFRDGSESIEINSNVLYPKNGVQPFYNTFFNNVKSSFSYFSKLDHPPKINENNGVLFSKSYSILK